MPPPALGTGNSAQTLVLLQSRPASADNRCWGINLLHAACADVIEEAAHAVLVGNEEARLDAGDRLANVLDKV